MFYDDGPNLLVARAVIQNVENLVKILAHAGLCGLDLLKSLSIQVEEVLRSRLLG